MINTVSFTPSPAMVEKFIAAQREADEAQGKEPVVSSGVVQAIAAIAPMLVREWNGMAAERDDVAFTVFRTFYGDPTTMTPDMIRNGWDTASSSTQERCRAIAHEVADALTTKVP